jgi:hypothetical protein
MPLALTFTPKSTYNILLSCPLSIGCIRGARVVELCNDTTVLSECGAHQTSDKSLL